MIWLANIHTKNFLCTSSGIKNTKFGHLAKPVGQSAVYTSFRQSQANISIFEHFLRRFEVQLIGPTCELTTVDYIRRFTPRVWHAVFSRTTTNGDNVSKKHR